MMTIWTDAVLVAKICGGLLAVALLLEAVCWFCEFAGRAWRQRQIDAIMAENARYARRDDRLKTWRHRDLTDAQIAAERRMHLVMDASTRKDH